MQSSLQETKDNQKNNFQSVWTVHTYTILTLRSEDDRLNVNIVNSFTADHFSRKLANIENILKDKNMFVFHLEHWISLIVQSNWLYLVCLNRGGSHQKNLHKSFFSEYLWWAQKFFKAVRKKFQSQELKIDSPIAKWKVIFFFLIGLLLLSQYSCVHQLVHGFQYSQYQPK